MRISDVTVFQIPDAGGIAMLVVVDTDAGVSGIGEVGIRSRQEAVKGALTDLRPLMLGVDALRTEHLWQVLSRGGFFPGDRILGAAIAAVDIALWDIKGRAVGLPVHQLLGGAVRDRVPCYTHVGLEDENLDALLADCRARVAQGWSHLRLVVPADGDLLEPRRAARAAVAQMVALRDALGDGVELLL